MAGAVGGDGCGGLSWGWVGGAGRREGGEGQREFGVFGLQGLSVLGMDVRGVFSNRRELGNCLTVYLGDVMLY